MTNLNDELVCIPEVISGLCPSKRCSHKGEFMLVRNEEGEVCCDKTFSEPLYRCQNPNCNSSHTARNIFDYTLKVEDRWEKIKNGKN